VGVGVELREFPVDPAGATGQGERGLLRFRHPSDTSERLRRRADPIRHTQT
jgi:hypothetical protein